MMNVGAFYRIQLGYLDHKELSMKIIVLLHK